MHISKNPVNSGGRRDRWYMRISFCLPGELPQALVNAPALMSSRTLITDAACGVKPAEIEEPLMREIRYLDRLADEPSKSKAMEKSLRKKEYRRLL